MTMTAAATPQRVTSYLIILIFITTMGPLQFGYHLAELNAPKAVITCEKKTTATLLTVSTGLPQCIHMNSAQFGLVSSSFLIGGLFGALSAGPFSTKYGRLSTLRATTLFFILGPLAEALAVNIPIITLGRIVSGFGAGGAIVVGPIFIAEIAPPPKRGFFGAFTQIMINGGILISQSLGYFLSKDNHWRIILAVAGVIGILELIGLFFIPESPIWLAEHQHLERARQILQKIRGKNEDIEAEVNSWKIAPDPHNSNFGQEIRLTPSENPHPQKHMSTLRVILSPIYRPAVIAVVVVMITQQFTGINSIIMYSVSLLSTILPTTALLLAVIISALNLVTTFVCAPLADKLGRKTCLLVSIIGMGVNSILLAIALELNYPVLSAIATFLFVMSFAVGLGPIPWILASELVGPEAVGATQSWALISCLVSTSIVAQFFPILNDAMGGKGRVFWIFAGLAGALGAFIAWWVPETMGKTSMEEVWGRDERQG